jgi:hypothetical protein
MRTSAFGCVIGLAALVVGSTPTAAPGQPEVAPAPRPVVIAKVDRSALSGTWMIVGLESEGEKYSQEQIKAVGIVDEFIIDAKAGTFRREFGAPFIGGAKDNGTFEIVEEVKAGIRIETKFTRFGGFGEGRPKETSGTSKDLWQLVEKGRLRVCRGSGKDWPDGFTTKKRDGLEVVIYERKKP